MNDDSTARIVASLRSWVARAAPGARLPSTRELVARHRASPVTVQRALRELSTLGLVETRPGVGTFVAVVRTARPADYGWQTAALGTPPAVGPSAPTSMRDAGNEVIALHSGYPDPELLPERLVRAALVRAARGAGAVVRPPAAGLPELQSWFARELAATSPVGVIAPAASDVVVLPGSQAGLSAVFRALVGAGRPLLVESPTYWGAITAAAQAGVRVVPLPTGAEGPDPAEVDRAFAETGARVLYAQPTYANPTGTQWSPTRGDEVLEVVRHHGAFLLEDDWAHDFGITTTPLPLAARDDGGHVIHLRSLTKSVSPSVRVAAVVARGPARERVLADHAAGAMYVSGLLQAAALDVVTQPAWRTHLRGVREQLRARRDLLVDSLHELAPTVHVERVPAGGLNLWARLPDGTDVEALGRRCERRGLFIAPGTEWFPAEPTGVFLRLGYSGPRPERFPEAARILGEALDTAGS